jgi:thioredoxin 1
MTIPQQITDASFDAQVLKCDIPVLVDFWADWCGPCQAMAPYLKEIADTYAEQLRVVKLDVDANPQTPANYGVLGLPTFILFKFGQPVERLTGTQAKEAILNKITPYLDR